MKVLFQSINLETPHFETELELMTDHLDAGDEVYLLACHGEMGTCFGNAAHLASRCLRCQGRLQKGLEILGGRVKVISYPLPPQARYSELPESFATIEELKKFQLGHAQLGLGAASSLITRMNREHCLDTLAYAKEVYRELATSYYVYLSMQRVLADVRPDKVYLFNGRFSTVLPALNACEELGVPYATHERGGSLNLYWLVQGTIPHDIDNATREMHALWSSLPTAEAQARGSRFFTDRRDRVEHCWYSFTKEQKVNALPSGFDPNKKNISLFNSTIEEFAAIRCWPRPYRVYDGEIEAIARICESLADDSSYHVYLRIHPNLKGFDNTQTRDLNKLVGKYTNLTVISPASVIDSYALMDGSSAIVTFGSTIGAEACYWGKPSILLGRALYENLDCSYQPDSHDEVISLLKMELPPRSQEDAMKYGLWDLGRGTPFKHYVPKTLTAGLFRGTQIAPGWTWKIRIGLALLFEANSYKKFYQKSLKAILRRS